MWGSIFLVVFGTSFGLLAAAGVFTVLVAVGIVPRFAGKTHTAGHVLLYEDMVIWGTVVGCIVSIFERYFHIGTRLFRMGVPFSVVQVGGNFVTGIIGLFSGMFIGCLALAIAEMLNSIPIFSRRTGFRHGLGIALLFAALGKMAGSIFYFLFIQ